MAWKEAPGSPSEQRAGLPVAPLACAPLSFAQSRWWFLDQIDPGNAVFNAARALRFYGPLDVEVLTRALSDIVRRHEPLRTQFLVDDGTPVQFVQPARALSLPIVDLTAVPQSERQERAHEWIVEEARRSFDLTREPGYRVTLVRLTAEDHLLVQVFHHIISDGWSMGLLFRELTTLYQALAAGNSSPLAELPSTYADFAVSQRQWLQGSVLEGQLAYWREKLRGAPTTLQLPTDHPRPRSQTFEGTRVSFSLGRDQVDALTRLSRQERVSLFMTLLAAFNALLWRHSGQTDVVIGIPTAGRTRLEVEQLIGCFANTLVLRTDLSGNPTFDEIVRRVREIALGAYGYQELPFAKLVEEMQPARTLSYNPLFQVLFNFRDFPPRREQLGTLTIEDLEVDLGTVLTDLEVAFIREADGLTCRIVGNTRLFDAATLERLARHYQEIIETIVEDPTRRLSEFTTVTARDRYRMTVDWNNTAADRSSDGSAHHLFELQAATTPKHVALTSGEIRFTYEELDQASSRLASYLRGRGIGSGVRVGVYLERSPHMVICLLAVLRVGAAYLPLDPEHPKERLGFILQDAAPAVILTQSSLADDWSDIKATIICVDREQQTIDREPVRPPIVPVPADYPAYLIYTSGSTGNPKGVVVPHRSLVNFLESMRECPGLNADDVLVAVTTLSFDIAALELLLPLIVGAQVVLASQEVASDGRLLAALLDRTRATVLQATPSTWRLLIEAGWTGSPDLRALCGGEALPGDLAALLQDRCAAVWNLYGPTETTIWSTVQPVTTAVVQAVVKERTAVPIGSPIANTQVHVLDPDLQLVPIGVPGELCIGGLGVANGYVNQPGLTAEKFVPDPFGSRPGARLYRTGDRVRWRADGTLAFLGRLDRQVKILGHRIEPAEIETVLSRHPAVQACAVTVQDHRPGESRLVGYIVPRRERAPSISELRAFLLERLPEYMVPHLFQVLAALPLNANGKLDYRALPFPGATRPALGSHYVAPRTPVESELAELWTSLLKVDRVGVEDNFFELGGHSLLASQVVARARVAFGVELPLRSLFERPTVGDLAQAIDQARLTSAPDDAEQLLWELDQLSEEEAERLLKDEQRNLSAGPQFSRLDPIPRRPAGMTNVPLSFAQQRMWFYNQLEPDSFAYNQARATRWVGPLDIGALEQSLTELLRRHEVLRSQVELSSQGPVQQVMAPRPVVLTQKDLTALPSALREDTARQWIVAEGRRPFVLTGEMPFRALVVRLAPNDHVLALIIHHIAFDRWSSTVLLQELTTLYSAYAGRGPSPLPELPLQYGDFAEWQRQRVSSAELTPQWTYWRDRLRGLSTVLELPFDRPRPAVQTHRGDSVMVSLATDLTAKLGSVARSEGGSLFMALLAGFKVLLWHHTAQPDLAVGVVIAGRSRVELESLIGCFTNTLVMRTDLSSDPSFRELVGRVRDVTLGALANQDVPFEKLVEELRPERSVKHHPLFQVLMNYLDLPQAQLTTPEVAVDDFEVSLGTAFVDLALDVNRKGPGFTASFAYNTDLFDRSTIEGLTADYLVLLERVAIDPETRLSSLSLLMQNVRIYGNERPHGDQFHTLQTEPPTLASSMRTRQRAS